MNDRHILFSSVQRRSCSTITPPSEAGFGRESTGSSSWNRRLQRPGENWNAIPRHRASSRGIPLSITWSMWLSVSSCYVARQPSSVHASVWPSATFPDKIFNGWPFWYCCTTWAKPTAGSRPSIVGVFHNSLSCYWIDWFIRFANFEIRPAHFLTVVC